MSGRRGFRNSSARASGANVDTVMFFYAEDKAAGRLIGDVPPYVFDENGRISTTTHNGAAITVPDSYTFGEMWEMRWTFAETGNSQRQGIYIQVGTTAANSAPVRAIEAGARASANVAVGTVQGALFTAYTGSATDAAITTLLGASIEAQMGSSYTGTVTTMNGLQVKLQTEDGSTITGGYGLYIYNEAVTGGKRVTAAIGIAATAGLAGYRYIIDSTGVETTNGGGNEVVLLAFKGSNGTTYYLIHDTDAATVVSVVTSDPTS